jgi:hypothetical protein
MERPAVQRRFGRRGRGALAAVVLSVAVSAIAVCAAALLALGATRSNAQDSGIPGPCVLHLSLHVTPDVPNPGDGGFLSSLLGNNVGYQLSVERVVDDTHVDVVLYGPGPAANCQQVLQRVRQDGRVQSINVRS